MSLLPYVSNGLESEPAESGSFLEQVLLQMLLKISLISIHEPKSWSVRALVLQWRSVMLLLASRRTSQTDLALVLCERPLKGLFCFGGCMAGI